MALAFHIRDARLPDETPQLLPFIMGSQHFEHAIEPDRRLDDAVAREHFDLLVPLTFRRNGRVLVADEGARLLGWGVVHEDDNDVYVLEDERRHGYIAELFVVEESRGQGVGRALIAACEDWARERKLKALMIGVLPGNTRAARIYDSAGFSPYALRLRKYL